MKISVIWEGNSKITIPVPDRFAEGIFNLLASKLMDETTRLKMRERINSSRRLEEKFENTVERREL